MSKYDILRQINQNHAQATQNVIADTQSVLKNGMNIVNTVGGIVGEKQATDYLDAMNEDFYLNLANNKFTYNDDGSPMTAEESIAAYTKWEQEYKANNKAPSNPWASKHLQESLDGYRQQRLPSIMMTSAETYRKELDSQMNEGLAGLKGDYRAIANPSTYTEDTMLLYNKDINDLSPEARKLYEISIGAAPEENGMDRALSAKMFRGMMIAEQAGYNGSVAYRLVDGYRFDYAANDLANTAATQYSQNVINGNMTKDQFLVELDDFIARAGTDGLGGFSAPLTIQERASVKAMAENAIDTVERGRKTEVARIYNEQVLPAIFTKENNGILMTSENFYSTMAEFGLTKRDVDKWFSDENKLFITNLTRNNDVASAAMAFTNELNAIYGSEASAVDKATEANKLLDSITDPYVFAAVVDLGKGASLYGGYWNNANSKQIAIRLTKTFSDQPDLSKIGTGTSSSGSFGTSPTEVPSRMLTDSEYRAFGLNVVMEMQNPDHVLPMRFKANDDLARQMFIEEKPDEASEADYTLIYRTDDNGVSSHVFQSDSVEADYQNYKRKLYDSVMSDYLANIDYEFADGSTMKSMIANAQKLYEAEYLTYTSGFFVTGGIPDRELTAAENKRNMYARIVETGGNREAMNDLYNVALSNKSKHFYTEADWKELNEYFSGEFTTALNNKGIDLKEIIETELNISSDDPEFRRISELLIRRSWNDIMGEIAPNIAQDNIVSKAREIHSELASEKIASALLEIDSFGDIDRRKDLRSAFTIDDSRALAGRFFNGDAPSILQEDLEYKFTGDIVDGKRVNSGAAQDAVQLQNIIYSDEGVAYNDNERFIMCLAASMGMDISLNDQTTDHSYSTLMNILETTYGPTTEGIILGSASALEGMSDIYKELSDDWGLDDLTVINGGRSFQMGNYEIRVNVDSNGAIVGLEGRKLGSDAKDWLDMTILSPAKREQIFSFWESKLSRLPGFGNPNITNMVSGTVESINSRNTNILNQMLANDPTANAILTMMRNLNGEDYKFVVHGLGANIELIPAGDNE